MNRKQRIILDIIKQILIVVGLGAVLYWIYSKQQSLGILERAPWFIYIFYLCVALYLLLLLYTFRRLFINYSLRRFDPGDPDSLAELNKMRRFHFSDEAKAVLRQTRNPVAEVKRLLRDSGFVDVSASEQGIVYLRKIGSAGIGKAKYDRLILTYRPVLNVLIVDNILNDVQYRMDDYVDDGVIRMNIVLLLTDMKLETETLSAGAGVVNYLCTSETGALFPMLIDLYYGKIFYPLDRSMLKTGLKLRQNNYKKQLAHLFEPASGHRGSLPAHRKYGGLFEGRKAEPSIRKPGMPLRQRRAVSKSGPSVRPVKPDIRNDASPRGRGDTLPRAAETEPSGDTRPVPPIRRVEIDRSGDE